MEYWCLHYLSYVPVHIYEEYQSWKSSCYPRRKGYLVFYIKVYIHVHSKSSVEEQIFPSRREFYCYLKGVLMSPMRIFSKQGVFGHVWGISLAIWISQDLFVDMHTLIMIACNAHAISSFVYTCGIELIYSWFLILNWSPNLYQYNIIL